MAKTSFNYIEIDSHCPLIKMIASSRRIVLSFGLIQK
jgi:hypothetical protein